MAPCKSVKEQFELCPNMLVGIRGMMCSSWDGGSQDIHLPEKYSCFKGQMYKLTGNKIPHPFLTYSSSCPEVFALETYTLTKGLLQGQKALKCAVSVLSAPQNEQDVKVSQWNFQVWGVLE